MIREVRGPELFVSLSFKFILPFVRFALVNRPFSFLFRFPILEEATVFRMRPAPSSSVTGAHAWRIHGKVLRRYSGRLISLVESSPFDCAALFLRSLPLHPLALPVSSRFYSRFSRFPFLPDRPLNPSLYARSAKLCIIAYTRSPCLSTSIHFSVSCLSLRLRRMISMQWRKSAFILYL